MMKVKVSEEVAKVLSGAKEKYYANIVSFMKKLWEEIPEYVPCFLGKHNLTDEDLINAYKYGWEVEYEFQVGDIVKCNSTVFIVSEHDLEEDTIFQHNKKYYTLVCKAENREDLKQC